MQTMQKHFIGSTISVKIPKNMKQNKLEIWGKANVSPPGTLSPIGGKFQRGEIPLVAKSHGPNSYALAYAERPMST